MQERIAFHLQRCITRSEVLDWMTTGRTVLLLEDKSKENEVSNYRSITCLPIMLKLLTGVAADDCCRNIRGTKDQLLIDKAVMKNCRRRKVELSMVWIDYRKAHDMVPHSWILKNPWRSVELQITYLIFRLSVWKVGTQS